MDVCRYLGMAGLLVTLLLFVGLLPFLVYLSFLLVKFQEKDNKTQNVVLTFAALFMAQIIFATAQFI